MTGPLDPDRPPGDADLAPTWFLDFEHPDVAAFAQRVTAGCADDASRAAALFAEVRDTIWYDPHDVSRDPEDYDDLPLDEIFATFDEVYPSALGGAVAADPAFRPDA
ncbi:MAG TPA: hypothetical protein VFU14_17720 [Acidimicrobiales bacterium]|nr:hypothetical protein [Acidimicrobiales bacterium]